MKRPGWPELLIVAGSCLFIFALWLSAYLEPAIGWLHFFQGWMYVATIVLSLRRNRWGYFIGFSAAAFWDYANLFVTNFFASGLHWLLLSIRTAQLQHLAQIVAVPAWLGNLLVVIGSVWGYARQPQKHWSDLIRLSVASILTTGFFAADMVIFQPRYLSLFHRIFHPHLPW